ncbi:HlyD family efflux transporter periplasmic adaptor subunit [Halarsenatibacter silvermanii]|uniref:Putative membrane fusion protein n=1 Tax=Halarsenatibacter silvermanii TaxID=321763 RepID=A0A1G9JMT5_9FIRM|nr:HlyD family efflux transporter periplasmic adaptor subunit [Halarsenatibacter silvermanii]SDL38454.1 putative membrane fusion protein [Halarsenatibacter silvermanii]
MKIKIFIVVLLLALLLGLLISLLGTDVNLQIAAYGELEEATSATAIILRDEKTFSASLTGELKTEIAEGEAVPYGEKIAAIEGEGNNISVYADKAGIISYTIDGMEDKEFEDLGEAQTSIDFEEISIDQRHYHTGVDIEAGEVFFRIVDNRSYELIMSLPENWADRFQTGEEVLLRPDDDSRELRAEVKEAVSGENNDLLLVETKDFYDRWLSARRVEIELVKDIHSGIIIPESALFNTPRGRGVLVYEDDDKMSFRTVTVVAETEEKAAVEGLELGTQVVTNPSKISYGRGLD